MTLLDRIYHDRPTWFDQAACAPPVRGSADVVHVRKFFPVDRESPVRAKRICAVCPVRDRCLDYALERPELRGVWGGTTAGGRERMRRGRRELPEGWS